MENVVSGSLVEILRRHGAMLEPTPIVLLAMEDASRPGGPLATPGQVRPL